MFRKNNFAPCFFPHSNPHLLVPARHHGATGKALAPVPRLQSTPSSHILGGHHHHQSFTIIINSSSMMVIILHPNPAFPGSQGPILSRQYQAPQLPEDVGQKLGCCSYRDALLWPQIYSEIFHTHLEGVRVLICRKKLPRRVMNQLKLD